MEERNTGNKIQNLYLENRETLKITGVEQVENFNEHAIEVYSVKGMITIKGNGMHISKLNLDDGTLKIEGNIDSVVYSNKTVNGSKGKGFLGKLFK